MKSTPSNDRLFLYIDLLGFSLLVKDGRLVESVYGDINNLNVFMHGPYFKSIAFSDTILVYSSELWSDCTDRVGAIMWMCEFAQDLFYRLVGKKVHFRALLTVGDFNHAKMTNIDSFYGEALIRTYEYERKLICMGLFMDNRLVQYSQIFHTDPYDNEYHFVHIMQNLQRISHDQNAYPLFHGNFTWSDTHYLHAYDLTYVRGIYETMIDHTVDPRIRAKYLGTWQMLRTRSAALLDIYVSSNFDPRSISDFDWTEAFRRVGTADGFYG